MCTRFCLCETNVKFFSLHEPHLNANTLLRYVIVTPDVYCRTVSFVFTSTPGVFATVSTVSVRAAAAHFGFIGAVCWTCCCVYVVH